MNSTTQKPTKRAETQNRRVKQFLHALCAETDLVGELLLGTIGEATLEKAKVLMGKYKHGMPKIRELPDLIALLSKLPDPEALSAYNTYKSARTQARRELYDTRRHFRRDLGLGREPMDVAAMCSDPAIKTWVRERAQIPCVKRGFFLHEPGLEYLEVGVATRSVPKYATVGDSADWLRIPADESAIIRNKNGSIQLVVLRNLCRDTDVLQSVNSTIDEAVLDRNNVRPQHPGSLIQAGYNAGSREPPRFFGLVNNLREKVKKLSDDVRMEKDLKIIGAFSLFWNLARAHAPAEIVTHVEAKLEDSGMPEMAGKDSEDTSGYKITVAGQDFIFPSVRRAPSEGYLAKGYISSTHIDHCWADFAFAWQTGHTQLASKLPTGGNFVDVTLQVIVDSSPDTLLIFEPCYVHGTTISDPGVFRHGLVIAFSTHIKEAYDIAVAKERAGESPLLYSL